MNISLSPTETPRVWRWEGITLAGLFGVGLVLWPFLAFGAIFMFDSPLQNRSDELNRNTIAFFIWFYPATYLITGLFYYLLRRFGVGRLISCFAWVLPVVTFFILPYMMGWQNTAELNPKRVQLLYRTDHLALLSACRDVLTNRNAYAKDPHGKDDSLIDRKDPKLPAVITTLRPTYIATRDNWVSMGLHDGIDHLGVVVDSEEVAGKHTNDSSGIMLVPGLWFYDHELSYQQTDRAAYIQRLKALKPADAPDPKW